MASSQQSPSSRSSVLQSAARNLDRINNTCLNHSAHSACVEIPALVIRTCKHTLSNKVCTSTCVVSHLLQSHGIEIGNELHLNDAAATELVKQAALPEPKRGYRYQAGDMVKGKYQFGGITRSLFGAVKDVVKGESAPAAVYTLEVQYKQKLEANAEGETAVAYVQTKCAGKTNTCIRIAIG